MSIYVMLPVFETTKLTASEKLVALSLADNAHDDGTSAYPSISTTAAKTSLSERTITRILQSLIEKNIIDVQKRATNTFPTTYRFLLSKDGKYLAVDAPGGDMMTPQNESGGDIDDTGGDIEDSSGCHGVTQTVIETSDESSLGKKKKGRPRKNPEPKYTPEFEEFYALYPKPLNKEQSFKNWEWSTKTRGIPASDIMNAVHAYLKEIGRKGTDPDFIIVSTNFVGRNQRWTEYQVATIEPETRRQARAWDEWEQVGSPIGQAPVFPRPKNSEGYLLDGNGRAYYIDPMQPTKRRYLDDE